MNLAWTVFGLMAGPIALALAVFFRLGKTWYARKWSGEYGSTPSNILLMLPGGGFFLTGLGLLRWSETPVVGFVSGSCLVLGAILVLWGGMFRVPMWVVPRWARERVAARRKQQKGK